MIRAAKLFDGREVVDEPVVVIDGDRIVAVGESRPSDEVHDLGDVTLLPGLIDTHQHLCFNQVGTLEEQVAEISDHDLLDRARQSARRALRAGITTVRDLGDRDFITLGLRGERDLPTVLCSGPPLTRPAGHCWYLGGCCDGVDELVAAVHERKRRGCDVVKIMVTGGSLTATFPMWESQFSAAEVRAVVDAAHEVGLPVAAHCHGQQGIADAADAGVDTIEHCSFAGPDARSHPDGAVLDRMVSNGVVISATLGVDRRYPMPPRIAENFPIFSAAFAEFRARGGRVVVGTDGGIAPTKPHDVLPLATRDLAEIGMDGHEILATLTWRAAEVCGVAERKGRLAPGYDADMIAVAGDAVDNPHALHDVRAVWRAGAMRDLST